MRLSPLAWALDRNPPFHRGLRSNDPAMRVSDRAYSLLISDDENQLLSLFLALRSTAGVMQLDDAS